MYNEAGVSRAAAAESPGVGDPPSPLRAGFRASRSKVTERQSWGVRRPGIQLTAGPGVVGRDEDCGIVKVELGL